jgi:hypothetical protein
MFSATYDIDEAVAAVAQLSHFFFTSEFDRGVEQLNKKTGLSLAPIHIRQASRRTNPSDEQLTRLRELLRDEYTFLQRIRSLPAT